MSNFSLLGHAAVTRGENRRDVQLADLVLIDLEDETPKSDESAPCMIMTMRQGKQNQHGKIEYMGCMRNLKRLSSRLGFVYIPFKVQRSKANVSSKAPGR